MTRAPAKNRSSGHASVVASHMGPAFTAQIWSLLPTGGQVLCHCFLLVEGDAVLRLTDDSEVDLSAPMLVWIPAGLGRQLQVTAGGYGMIASASESFVWRTIGASAMAIDLRPFLSEVALASEGSFPLTDALVWFESMEHELRAIEAGSTSVVSFALGTILIHLWRAMGSLQRQVNTSGGSEGLVQRYKQLIELHFRDRIGVEGYATQLGVTRGRLTDACTKVAGMAPQEILHARLIDEAKRRLKQSAVSIEQIAYSLGFRDPAYFNRFFTRLTGTSPGVFRKATRKAERAEARSFAAWP